MPRRRRWSPWAPPTPPAAIPVLAPTLNLAGLSEAYSWMSIDRLASLKLAHEWYAEAITPANHKPSPLLYQAPLDAAQQKTFDMAVKVKGVGNSTPYPEEKATFLEKTIRMYEQIWSGRNLPKLDDAKAATTVSSHVQAVQKVLSNFNAAFASTARFRMTFGIEREFLEGEVLLPKAEVERMIGEPPLKAVLAEATTVAKVASITTVDGQQKLDGQKFMATLPQVLSQVYAWAASADKPMKAIGKVTVMPASASGTAPKVRATPVSVPMGARTRLPANDPYGIFKANTVKAAISQTLSDKQWHPLQSLKSLCQTYGVSDGMVGTAMKDLEKKAGVKFDRRGKDIRIA